MEDLFKLLIGEQTRARIAQERTNELLEEMLNQGQGGKDPNELLTVKKIQEEYGIGDNKIRQIFLDKDLPVQRYTRPFKVTRKAFEKYLNSKHDF